MTVLEGSLVKTELILSSLFYTSKPYNRSWGVLQHMGKNLFQAFMIPEFLKFDDIKGNKRIKKDKISGLPASGVHRKSVQY